MENSVKISGLVITYNEFKNIKELLKNIDFVDEIVIVDSFSTDNTKQIALEFEKVKFIEHKFQDFTSQRNFALQQAKNNWILFLDADERVTPKLKAEILQTVAIENSADAYYFYRKFYYENKPIHFSGTQTDKNFRLFKKDKVIYKAEKLVHETLEVNGIISVLKNKLIHYSLQDYQSYRKKMIHFGKLKALELSQKNKKSTFLKLYFKPIYKFLYSYFVRLGFLDGVKGIKLCYLQALSVFVTFSELKTINLQKEKNNL